MMCSWICSVLVWLSVVILVNGLKLELASVVFRHGQRTPTDSYPTDRYKENHWPQGFGQLTIIGMQQQYFLGQVLRDRYVNSLNLIHPNYTRTQVYVRSTDYDRTLMSAEAQLAGLFPPQGDQVFNSSLPWQPIPVHTVPKVDDNLLRAYGSDCPRYKQLLEANKKSAIYIATEEKNKEFFDRLSQDTGEPVNLTNVWSLQDTLLVQAEAGLPSPSWLRNDDMARLTELAAFTLTIMFNSKGKKRLTAGNWLGKVLEDMKYRKADPQEDMRLYLYSAHDTTVACMTSGLGVFNGILPPYTATFIIELYSDEQGGYFVSLFYRNETDSDTFIPLSLESCSDPILCTLDEFTKLASSVIPDDWESECGINTESSSNDDKSNISVLLGVLFGVIVMLLAIAVAAFVVLYCHYRQLNNKYIIMQETTE